MKLLIGGSPCTHWSIAQTKHRETTAEGIGWELFLNYRIARDKYKPDYFLYENNKSMSPAIRAQITAELGVEPVVRCKDCENSYYAVDDLICSYGPCVDCPVSPDFWCANGRRREDAHAQD